MAKKCHTCNLGATIMKHTVPMIVLFVLINTCDAFPDDITTDTWGPITNDAQMAITPKYDGAGLKTNQPFGVIVRLRNLSTNETFYSNRLIEPIVTAHFYFNVIAPSAKEILPIPNMTAAFGRIKNFIVRPNDIYSFDFDLGVLCKFNELGTYKIIGKMRVGRSTKGFLFITSNQLSLSVVPGQWKAAGTNAPARL